MIIEREILVNSTIQNTWKLLGNDFNNVYKWASIVAHSSGHGNSDKGAPCDTRQCEVKGLGSTKEKVLKYSDTDHVVQYQIEAKGLPSMVKYASTTWSLTSINQNQTKVKMQIEMRVAGIIGAIMKPMMRMQMGGMAETTVSDFKHFAETGKPSARKLNAIKQ